MADYGSLGRLVYQTLTNINSNSHASVNESPMVVYPYLTYDIRTDPSLDTRNQENLTIDVQIFDNIKSYSNLYDWASDLVKGFKGLTVENDSLRIRFDVRNGASNWLQIPTGDPNIVRLEGTIQGKIDWREM